MPQGNWAHIGTCKVIGEIHGSRTTNVFHLATDLTTWDAGPLPQPLVDLGAAMLECIRETLLPSVSADWKLVHIESQRFHPAITDVHVTTALPTDIGTRASTNVSFCAMQLNLRTGQGGRSRRGKKFLPPCGDADITQSEIDDAILLLLAQFLLCLAEKFMGANPTSGWHLGVFSKKLATAIGGTPNTGFHVVTTINPVANPAIMGSRKRLVGV